MNQLGQWECTEISSTIVSAYHYEPDPSSPGSYVWVAYKYREELTQLWECPVADSQGFPAAVQDPGNLVQQGWRCENRKIIMPYGSPLCRHYTETFVKKGSWTPYA